jgi:hypothetical protein
MDCRTARLFLHFNRPGANDLDGPEREELNEHLAHCTECNALAGAERRLDQHLGRAMRAVEVPEGLRNGILNRLACERGEWYRRRFAQVLRGLTAAAALVLVGIGLWWLTNRPPKTLSTDQVVYAFNVTPAGDVDGANEALKRLESWGAPPRVNYAYLTGWPAMATLPGYEKVKVPQLVFTGPPPKRGGVEQKAVIYVIADKQFNIEDLDNQSHGYKYRLEVYKPAEQGGYTYLVLYTGESWNWLLKEKQ